MDTSAEISFRPIEAQDLEFLRHLYASTRQEKMKLVPWDDADKEKFLSQQFNAQHDYYQLQFSGARFDLIVRNQAPIGRLYVDRREGEIHVIDISLLTEHRGHRIGGTIMRGILDETAVSGKAVTIYVERRYEISSDDIQAALVAGRRTWVERWI